MLSGAVVGFSDRLGVLEMWWINISKIVEVNSLKQGDLKQP